MLPLKVYFQLRAELAMMCTPLLPTWKATTAAFTLSTEKEKHFTLTILANVIRVRDFATIAGMSDEFLLGWRTKLYSGSMHAHNQETLHPNWPLTLLQHWF